MSHAFVAKKKKSRWHLQHISKASIVHAPLSLTNVAATIGDSGQSLHGQLFALRGEQRPDSLQIAAVLRQRADRVLDTVKFENLRLLGRQPCGSHSWAELADPGAGLLPRLRRREASAEVRGRGRSRQRLGAASVPQWDGHLGRWRAERLKKYREDAQLALPQLVLSTELDCRHSAV